MFRATETAFRRDVALKVLMRFDLDDELRRRFRRECETAGALSWHPGVVTVFGQGLTGNGFPYLAMEYLPGGNLADMVTRTGPLPWPVALGYGAQLADALAAAHDVGFLHRDVKPENSLIDRFGHAKLADFGIAAITTGTRTATGIVTATVIHAAPEVLAGQRATPASDLYSLGSTLHTLLAGTPPFTSTDDENIFALLMRIANTPPPDLALIGVPAPVAALVSGLLAKEPTDPPTPIRWPGHCAISPLPVTTSAATTVAKVLCTFSPATPLCRVATSSATASQRSRTASQPSATVPTMSQASPPKCRSPSPRQIPASRSRHYPPSPRS